MKIVNNLFLVSSLVAWKADLTLSLNEKYTGLVRYDLKVTSDAGGTVNHSCFRGEHPKASNLSCSRNDKETSSQGGYWVENLNCKDKCCTANVVTKNPQKSYNINVCYNCVDFDINNPKWNKDPIPITCVGSKSFSLFTDGSMKYN
ncbi:hypothetical protein CONCODRAFT_13289 [Conidiobolus coronatus NRRL 28638]|uniref:Secreted protein n=1 Tax=Conidiobolus coronatus (strain ATCC 28846 / CBS 209.66 / NRRL 28638) TaxID=796925 RepID=A0A137NR63_CONC2|nr:hypothetical protein CONCODRAFT_13289 [Conidiobolus coronatus NRRL 28638]|eukprot:KXN65212.1 hypothetical protein CONCODRAFT_13289 [Conidiobolus coronatus NRRL 28638]